MRQFSTKAAIAASFFALAATSALAQSSPQETHQKKVDLSRVQGQISALLREKASRTPAMRKMDSSLVYALRKSRGQDILKQVPKLRVKRVLRTDGTVDVEIKADISQLLVDRLQILGAQIEGVYPTYRSLNARIPLSSLESAAMLPGVQHIKPPSRWATDAGSLQSEGDKSMRTDELRTTLGLTGAGVKLGVLSDSDRYRENSQATGDLPASVQVLVNGRPGIGEGTAMMELVYDVAPGIALAFSSGGGGQAAFAQQYRDLFAAGCTVLSDDLFYFDEPAFQDGPVADAVNDIWAAGGIAFSSAGNAGNLRTGTSGVWEGDFADNGQTLTIKWSDGTSTEYPMHGYTNGDPANTITADGFGVATLQWNDVWANPGTDYDLFVVSSDGTQLVGAGLNVQEPGTPPYEEAEGVTGEHVVVGLWSGPDRVIRVNQIRGQLFYKNGGQTWGHNSAAFGNGVAAINAATTPQRAFNAADVTTNYSSDGLRRIYYDENGNLIAPGLTYAQALIRNRPVISGPDGTITTVPGFSRFFGTSAASPHVAALAGLLRQFAPDATPALIRDALTNGAVDILTAGFDKDSGAGAASGKGAIKYLIEQKTQGVSPNPATVAGTTAATLTLNLGRNAPPNGLTINVAATGNTSVFSVPSSFTVPAGASTANFSVGANGSGTGTITLNLTEAYTGAVVGTATVNRTSTGPTVSTLTLDPTTVVGASRNVAGRVELSSNATSTFTVELQSSNTAVAQVPATAAISTGQNFKTFVVTSSPVTTDTSVVIRARKQGTSDAWTEATLLVKAPKPISCVPSPTSGNPGTSVTFTVRLDGPAPTGGITAGLVTTDASVIAVPRTITIPAGATTASFTATAGPSAIKKTVTVSVRYQSVTVAQGRFVILVPEVSNLTISPTTVKGGAANATGTVTLDAPAPSTGITVKLSKSGAGGSVPATVTVPSGATSVNFTVTTSAVTVNRVFKVVAKTAVISKSASLTITP